MLSLSIVIPLFIVLVLSLSFHEAAHAWTSNRLGDPTAKQLGRLTLNPLAHIDWIGTVAFPLIAMLSNLPLIGWAKPVPVNMHHLREPRRDFAMVALAGPVSNLILAAVAAIVLRVLSPLIVESSGWTVELLNFLFQIVRLNTLLAVFNMIPVPPLDGGNVLMGLVPERVALGISWLRPYGFLIIYVLMLSGTLGQFVFPLSDTLVGWLL